MTESTPCAQAEGRMHGHRDSKESGARDLFLVEPLHGEVERIGRAASAVEEPERRGDGQRLVTKFIGGDIRIDPGSRNR